MEINFEELLGEDYVPYVEARRVSETIPFPQANSLDKVLALVNLLIPTGLTDNDLIDTGLVNSKRQAEYYANAAVYLGLARKDGDRYYRTRVCDVLKGKTDIDQKRKLAALVLAHPLITRLYGEIFLFDTIEERKLYIINSIDYGPNVLAQATMSRRGDCMYAWLVWVNAHLPSLG